MMGKDKGQEGKDHRKAQGACRNDAAVDADVPIR